MQAIGLEMMTFRGIYKRKKNKNLETRKPTTPEDEPLLSYNISYYNIMFYYILANLAISEFKSAARGI